MTTATADQSGLSLEWYRAASEPERLEFIQRLCREIAALFRPERIILFGSRAYGQPRADSDIDLLVVMPYKGRHTTQAIQIVNALKTLAPIDLLVRSPQEVRERLNLGDRFMREIIERGQVLYEANHTGMD